MPVFVGFVRGLGMVALDGGLRNRAVQALGGTVGSRVGRLGQAVRHAVIAADAVKVVPTEQE